MTPYLPSHADLRRNLPEYAIQMIWQGIQYQLSLGEPYVELMAWMATMLPSEMQEKEIHAVLHATLPLRDKPWRTSWYNKARLNLLRRTKGGDVDGFLKGLEPKPTKGK